MFWERDSFQIRRLLADGQPTWRCLPARVFAVGLSTPDLKTHCVTACHKEMQTEFLANSEGKRPPGRLRRGWKDTLGMDLTEIGVKV